MNETQTATSPLNEGLTLRKDAWWIEPALIGVGFAIFIVYATFRAFENSFYEIGPYLSPFYSPHIPQAWIDPLQAMVPWFTLSPALFILWMPAGFRATCYYYRKAYYRAYFMDPPACSVGHWGGSKYCGETGFPLVLQNAHRYFFYFAVLVLGFLWYDVGLAFFSQGVRVSAVNLIMLANVVLLSGYTFGCHAYRHLCGGTLDCFSACSRSKARFKVWSFVTKLNEHHMGWAWASLFSVGFTDFYIRQVAAGILPELRFF